MGTLGNLGTDYKFTGQREEASLGIYFFNARWYDGSLGRFLSPDTIVPTGTQGTQAWDRYAFVNNNPVRYNDPTGHEAEGDDDEKENNNSKEEVEDSTTAQDGQVCEGDASFGWCEGGGVITLTVGGYQKVIVISSASAETMSSITNFKLQYSSFENNLDDAKDDTGDALLGAGLFVVVAIETGLTAPADVIPVVGQAKLGLEITALALTGALAVKSVYGMVSNFADAYDAQDAAYGIFFSEIPGELVPIP